MMNKYLNSNRTYIKTTDERHWINLKYVIKLYVDYEEPDSTYYLVARVLEHNISGEIINYDIAQFSSVEEAEKVLFELVELL